MEKWPNFLIVGAPKCGTTSLHEYLKNVPGVFMSNLKEPNYFVDSQLDIFQISDKKKYLDLFKNVKDEKAIGESSTIYLKQADPKKILETIPNVKIIISLRDPVEQVFSGYLHRKRGNRVKRTFHELVISIWENHQKNKSLGYWGFYEPVKNYLDTFGKNKVKIIIFEEWIKNPEKIVGELLEFLEVEQKEVSIEKETYNKFPEEYTPRNKIAEKILQNKKIKQIQLSFPSPIRGTYEKILRRKQIKPKMTQEEREKLIESFHDDIQKLEKMLGRKLPWSKFSDGS